jgi:hypothetical protein
LSELFTPMDGHETRPVLFVLLTEPNETPRETLEHRLSRFVARLSNATKTHLRVFGGLEPGSNTHAHLIVEVPAHEEAKFLRKLPKFQLGKEWPQRYAEMRPFESREGSYRYVLEKHDPWFDVACPRQHPCRGGCRVWK